MASGFSRLSLIKFPTSGGGGGGTITGANNGLSVSGTIIQLGGPLIQTTTINTNGHPFNIAGTTNASLINLQAPVAQTQGTPFISYTVNSVSVLDFKAGLVSGLLNSFFGVGSGNDTMTGTNNKIWGNNAFVNNTTGNHNTSIGDLTLAANTTGSYNIGIGGGGPALTSNTTGLGNIALGSDALSRNIIGNGNIGIGINPLKFSTGDYNIAIGYQTLQSTKNDGTNQTYTGNTAIGALTLGHNFLSVTVGNYNTCIGFRIGADINSSWGNNNTAIGNRIFETKNGPVGDNNIFIGAQINTNITTLGSNTGIIGVGIDCGLANIFAIGRTDQNIILGQTTVSVDNGNRLQINGSLSLASITLPVTPVNGSLETDGTNLYFTVGGVRKTVTLV